MLANNRQNQEQISTKRISTQRAISFPLIPGLINKGTFNLIETSLHKVRSYGIVGLSNYKIHRI